MQNDKTFRSGLEDASLAFLFSASDFERFVRENGFPSFKYGANFTDFLKLSPFFEIEESEEESEGG